jgi:hypothetical protein
MNIKELYEGANAYRKASPNRSSIVDLTAYDYLVEFMSESESYGKIFEPEITLEVIWERVIKTRAPFTLEYGYEALSEHIQDWLTEQKLWEEEEA